MVRENRRLYFCVHVCKVCRDVHEPVKHGIRNSSVRGSSTPWGNNIRSSTHGVGKHRTFTRGYLFTLSISKRFNRICSDCFLFLSIRLHTSAPCRTIYPSGIPATQLPNHYHKSTTAKPSFSYFPYSFTIQWHPRMQLHGSYGSIQTQNRRQCGSSCNQRIRNED